MHQKFISVIGQLSLDETASLIKRCKLFISNDTGLMHIATTVETPVIAIFGPTDQKRTAPYGKGNLVIRKNLECSPCYKFHIRKFKCKFNSVKCLNNISVEEVISACRNFIKKSANFSVRFFLLKFCVVGLLISESLPSLYCWYKL